MPTTIVRAAMFATVGLALTFGVSACGGVDKADVSSKIKSEKDFKGLPASFADCMAGVVVKYGDEQDVQDYVDGKIRIDYVGGLDGKAAKAAEDACTDAVTK